MRNLLLTARAVGAAWGIAEIFKAARAGSEFNVTVVAQAPASRFFADEGIPYRELTGAVIGAVNAPQALADEVYAYRQERRIADHAPKPVEARREVVDVCGQVPHRIGLPP